LYDELAQKFGWRELPERCRTRLEADFAAMARANEAARAPEKAKELNAARFARRHRQWMSLRDARARGEPLHEIAGDEVPVVPERAVTVNEVGTCPLTHGFHNDSTLCHLNSVLAVLLSIGLFAQFVLEPPSPRDGAMKAALAALLILCRTEQYVHDTDEVRGIIEQRISHGYFNAVGDPRDTLDHVVLCLTPPTQRVGSSRVTPLDDLLHIVGGKGRDGRLRRLFGVRIRAEDLEATVRDPWSSNAFPSWTASSDRWPMILTIGVESPDTVLVDVPTRITIAFPEALKVSEGPAIRAFVYELVGYVRRTVRPGQEPHATARVLVRREGEQLWWRLYDDWRKVSDVATPLDVVHDHVRLGFFVHRETMFDADESSGDE
jgi:hypothetical protein